MYSLFSNIEYYYKKTTYIAIASVFCALANVGLNYVFIKRFGYYAAGYTTLFCYVLLALFHFFFCKKILKKEEIPINSIFNLKLYLITFAAMLLIMIFMVITYDYFWVRYSMLAVIIVLVIIYRKKLLEVLKSVKR